MLRLELLGGFRLERDGVVIELNRPKVESFFAYLALYPQAHAREKLATLFWGETSDENARNSLRQALALVRKHIGADVLETTRETVQLNPDIELWVDARAIPDFRLTIDDLPSVSIEILKSKIENYKGELLHGYSDEWIFPEREKYQQLYLDALLHLTAHYRAASDYPRAIQTARRVISIDRANETAHQHLIVSHAALGDRTAARALYQELIRALDEELAAEPSPETRALVEKIEREANAPKSPHAALTNLPNPLTSFIGREKEIREIKELLDRERSEERGGNLSLLAAPSSLLTLLGPGGSGKTRLSIQVGRALVESFAHGVWWVEFAALNDGARVPRTIARALGVQEEPNIPLLESIAEFLREREMLLILDNCEHLISACAHAAEFLLERAPRLRILATSREPLNIGERAYPVPTLAMPTREPVTIANLAMEFDAVKLFVERASSVNPSFRLSEQNALTVANVVQRLDGIPLAIELAAARTRALNVEQIAARLDDRFNLLTSGSRTALPRQQTLRALIDWSYNLLTEQEQILFRRLGVFVGGWTLDAAEHVADANFDLLASLIDKSLVIAETNAGETRYRMLETIREYAREKLDAQVGAGLSATRELGMMQEGHLAYFLAFAENAAPRMFGAQCIPTLDMLDNEHDNLRAALAFANTRDDATHAVQLAGALGDFWYLRGHLQEARQWLDKLEPHAEKLNAPLVAARLFSSAGTIAWASSDFPRAKSLHQRALEMYEQADNAHGIALSLNNLASQYELSGEYVQAQDLFLRALARARAAQDTHVVVFALFNLGSFHLNIHHDYESAEANMRDALALAERAGDPSSILACTDGLAEIARWRGDYALTLEIVEQALPAAHALQQHQITNYLLREKGSTLALMGEFEKGHSVLMQALTTAQDKSDRWGTGAAFSRLAWLESMRGNGVRAARLFAFCERWLERISNASLNPVTVQATQEAIARVREQLGETVFQKEWEIGKALSEKQAVTLATTDTASLSRTRRPMPK